VAIFLRGSAERGAALGNARPFSRDGPKRLYRETKASESSTQPPKLVNRIGLTEALVLGNCAGSATQSLAINFQHLSLFLNDRTVHRVGA